MKVVVDAMNRVIQDGGSVDIPLSVQVALCHRYSKECSDAGFLDTMLPFPITESFLNYECSRGSKVFFVTRLSESESTGKVVTVSEF